MIIQLKKTISENERNIIRNELSAMRFSPYQVITKSNSLIVIQHKDDFDIRKFKKIKGIDDVFRVDDNYKLVSSKWRIEPTSILINDAKIGGNEFALIAGPCAIESEEQVISIVNHLVGNDIKFMRGGVFKPRTSPYSFRGLGIEGLKYFSKICKQNNVNVITEIMEHNQIDAMYDYVDVFQIGARNSQNFNLLDALGKIDKPVLLKRAISGTIEELLQSAEYMYAKGNDQIILCERGIRTYETSYRNTFDVNAIALLKEKSHLPVIADPSHGIGIRKHVQTIAMAATIAGADGIIYEVHPVPEKAKSDAQQTLNFEESKQLIKKINKIRNVNLQ